MKELEEILNNKRHGIDCTEAESAEIKGFVKEQLIQVGTKDVQMIEDIQLLFPIEYSEALTEMENNNI